MQTIDIFNKKVSVFKGVHASTPAGTKSIGLLVDNEKFADRVEAVRNEKNTVQKNILKTKLWAFTASGIFSGRNDKDLIAHSGVIAIDIDHKDNKHLSNYDELRSLISSVPYVAYCGHSVGGRGYFCLIPIKDPAKHAEHFASLQMDFKRCGINVDPSGSNVGRLRFVSHDPEQYINRNAAIYPFVVNKRQHREILKDRPLELDPAKFNEVKEWATIAKHNDIDITEGYNKWWSLACALAWEFGEEGRELFQEFSSVYSDYDGEESDRKYNDAMNAVNDPNTPHPTFSKIRELCTEKSITAINDFKN